MAQSRKKNTNRVMQVIILIAVIAVIAWIMEDTDSGDPGQAVPDPQAAAAEQEAQSSEVQTGPWGPDGYILQFSPDFNPGLASVDELGISVVIAVDVSGSMADPPAKGLQVPKYVQASKTLVQILDFLEDLSRSETMKGLVLKVGVLGFYAEIGEIAPLTVMDKAGFASLRTILDNPENFKPGGRTAIGLALEKGTEILAQSGTIFKSLIVLSDGENTEGVEPADVLGAINQNRNNVSTPDFPVSTRGTLTTFVGFDIDAGLFAPLGSVGSRVSAAADQAELKAALESVLMADITRLEKAAE